MVGFVPDTSVIIATVCSWHQHHAAAADEIKSRLASKQRMALAAPALIEAYAVLTRLPPPHRLAPADAHAVLTANFITGRKVISLDAPATTALLRTLAREGIAGGQTYDAVIARCARRVRAGVLLTFNDADFRPFEGPDLAVVVPEARL